MTETLSIRLDAETKQRLDALSKRSKRSKSFLAAQAITAYVESEEWQLGEIQAAIKELDQGHGISHEKVSKWLKSWGTAGETKAPGGRFCGLGRRYVTCVRCGSTSQKILNKMQRSSPTEPTTPLIFLGPNPAWGGLVGSLELVNSW